MAANLSPNDNFTTPSNSEVNLYAAQQISPVNSASGTPMNVSPTSPRNPTQTPYLPLHTRQIRPPKSPLYVPAVLRPTERPERPVRQSPLTPPRSVHGSLDSLDGVDAGRLLSRRSTGDSAIKGGLGRLVECDKAGERGIGSVTGLPTREHWKVSNNIVAVVSWSPSRIILRRRCHESDTSSNLSMSSLSYQFLRIQYASWRVTFDYLALAVNCEKSMFEDQHIIRPFEESSLGFDR